MFVRITKNSIWIGLGVVLALIFSANSYADYLYKGQYYKNRQDGSVYPVHPRKRKRHHRHRHPARHRHRGHSTTHRTIIRRLPAKPGSGHTTHGQGSSNYQRDHGRFRGLDGHRVEGAGSHKGSGSSSNGRRPPAHRVAPAHRAAPRRYRKACKSVDDAIWAAQRIYPGGRVISARPKRDHTGRRVSVEIRIMYKGRVAVVRERC